MAFFPGPARDSIAEVAEECKELVIHILQDIPQEPSEWPDCCIYRVPKQLREVNREAYTPKLVSIGPFHHGKDDLKDMEMHKLRYLQDFLGRTQKSSKDHKDIDKILLALLKIIKVNEKNIRHSYSEDCGLEKSGDDFVKMILLDAVFIIELFLKTYDLEINDYILSKAWLRDGILHDLILLENQLPFFVLEELYMFACCDEGQQIKKHKEDLKKEASRRFVELSRNYFRCYYKDKESKSIIEKKVKHFTDLLRYLFCPREILEKDENDDIKEKCGSKQKSPDSPKKQEDSSDIRFCATKLDDAGLNFEGVKDGRRLLDIQLPRPGVLRKRCFPCFGRPIKVPQLVIDDYTENLLRNLMALEQCLYPSQTYICNYVLLLDRLIDTDKDVDLLVHKKVIDKQLGSNDEVAALFNKLCHHIGVSESSYFDDIAQQLIEHYKYPLNHNMAILKREYFPNVFRSTATLVGLIVLVFTFWGFLRPFVV